MPTYSFVCKSPDHPEGMEHNFIRVINHREGKRIDQCQCDCGATAKRDLVADLASVNMVGATPISHSSTVGGAVAKEIEFVAGQFKKNPDGSVDRNHRPFRDTGELNQFMNGRNDLGKPKIGDDGKPIRRRDGSIVRDGAKLFKYGKNSTPSRDGIRRGPRMPSAWTDEKGVKDGNGVSSAFQGVPVHRNPTRRAQ